MDDYAGGTGAALDAQVVAEDNVGDPEAAATEEAKAKAAAENRRVLEGERDAAAAKVKKLADHLAAAQAELDRADAALEGTV